MPCATVLPVAVGSNDAGDQTGGRGLSLVIDFGYGRTYVYMDTGTGRTHFVNNNTVLTGIIYFDLNGKLPRIFGDLAYFAF